jgi:ribonuclease PH
LAARGEESDYRKLWLRFARFNAFLGSHRVGVDVVDGKIRLSAEEGGLRKLLKNGLGMLGTDGFGRWATFRIEPAILLRSKRRIFEEEGFCMRSDGRGPAEHRPVRLTRGFTLVSPGSVLVEMGKTRVLCTASIDNKVPEWLVGKPQGWLTAEYSMLPGSTSPRKPREKAKPDGRSVEIQRLIGRSLRSIINLAPLAGRSLWVDCDVIDADGGTRTASITGAFVALVDAIAHSDLADQAGSILRDSVAAISVGIVQGEVCLDLHYEEDSKAEVDLNLVMTGSGRFVEVQGTAESQPFSREELDRMISTATAGIESLTRIQRSALGERWPIG